MANVADIGVLISMLHDTMVLQSVMASELLVAFFALIAQFHFRSHTSHSPVLGLVFCHEVTGWKGSMADGAFESMVSRMPLRW